MVPSDAHAQLNDVDREAHKIRERLFDAATIRRLQAIGVEPGWRCLEIGAGRGSIARWMAQAVGPAGRVVATDLDTRHLDEVRLPNIDVRQHDIQHCELESGAYDLTHCRALLGNLRHPEAALPRIAAALKPGGWLLVEEADFASLGAASSHPGAANFNRIVRTIADAFEVSGVIHSYLGRELRQRLDQLGLVNVHCEGTAQVTRGGEDGARFLTLGFAHSIRRQQAANGRLTAEDFEELDRLLRDPSFCFVNLTMFAAWGQRPGPAALSAASRSKPTAAPS
jgi:ubiquinone/menaquinone biosynthesis C-methylase UbiE